MPGNINFFFPKVFNLLSEHKCHLKLFENSHVRLTYFPVSVSGGYLSTQTLP